MTPEQFIAAEMAKPWRWGENDCAKMADRWIQAVTGKSPIALSGQDYADAADAEALLQRWALPVRLARAMRKAGFRPAEEPRRGDLGIIVTGIETPCAIRGDKQWFFRTERGMAGASLDVRCLRAWRVE